MTIEVFTDITKNTNNLINKIIELDIENDTSIGTTVLDNLKEMLELTEEIMFKSSTDEELWNDAYNNKNTIENKIILFEYESKDNDFILGKYYSFCTTYMSLTNILKIKNKLFLSKKIFNLKNLTVLELSFCNLSVLPKEISNLTNLQELFLENNKLKTLPNEIINCEYLYYISLKYNNIETLNDYVASMPSLSYLNLTGNYEIKRLSYKFYLLQKKDKLIDNDEITDDKLILNWVKALSQYYCYKFKDSCYLNYN